jgi:hypothetical protein
LAACTATPTAGIDPTGIAQAVAETQTQAAVATGDIEPEPGATLPPESAAPSDTPAAGETAEATATATESPSPSPTPTDTPAPTSTPGAGPVAGPTSATPGEPGTITGSLGYPSEVIPRLKVYAWDREEGQWRYVVTNQNDSTYALEVPPGRYIVFAYLNEGGSQAGAYTNAVLCGLSTACTDHSLYIVTVGSGQQVSDVNVTDWYGPPGFVPAAPQ